MGSKPKPGTTEYREALAKSQGEIRENRSESSDKVLNTISVWIKTRPVYNSLKAFGIGMNDGEKKALSERLGQVIVRSGDGAYHPLKAPVYLLKNLDYLRGETNTVEGEYDGTLEIKPSDVSRVLFSKKFDSKGSAGTPTDIYLTGNHNPDIYIKTDKKPRRALKPTVGQHGRDLPVYKVRGERDTVWVSPEDFKYLKNTAKSSKNTTRVEGNLYNNAGESVLDAYKHSVDWDHIDDKTMVATPYDVFDFQGAGKQNFTGFTPVRKSAGNKIGSWLDKQFNPFILEGIPTVYILDNDIDSYKPGGQIKPNFIQRLEDPNRKSILDWASRPTYRNRYTYDISTHKMGYEYAPDDTGRAIVFPEVQGINGKLVDFTRPPYHSWAGYDSALDRGDYLMMKDLEEARKWVEGYKDRYKNLK